MQDRAAGRRSRRPSQGLKDWTKLDSYSGLTWDQAQETLRTCGHMLAFGDDAWAIQTIKDFQASEGEAAMAVFTASLFIGKHGAGAAATTAVGIYRKIARELNRNDLACRVENLAFMVYFADHGVREPPWPIPFPYDDVQRRAGMANVLLAMAMRELWKDGASTSESVAALGIQRFFDEGKKSGR